MDESLICVPEDDEIILVCPDVESFPVEIIDDVFAMSSAVI